MKKEINKTIIFFSTGFSAASALLALLLYRLIGELNILYIFIIIAFCVLVAALSSFLISGSVTQKILGSIKVMLSDDEKGNGTDKYSELGEITEKLKEQIAVKNDNEHMRHEFTANVSHELKTPLTSISGYAEMIATGMATGEDVKLFAEKIHSESGRLVTLIGDIIKLSELDENDEKQEFTAVDILPIASETAELLSFNAERLNIEMTVSGESCTVMGNEAMLSELIYNLCDNAIRYNRKNGKVNIEIKKDGEYSLLTVSDTGIGIPKEHQMRIFERFYRVDKSRSKETGGTGLGLAIVKHIAIQHSATIETVSDGKTGTKITVRFPKAVAQDGK